MHEMEEQRVEPAVEMRPLDELKRYLPHLVLLLILALGAYLRFTGLDWDEGTHLHPDERFLTLVATALQPVGSLGEYFDTANSTLNPNNVGYGFFVYGTLPVFVVRYLAEWLGSTGYGEVHLVGRTVSASADMISILLVYLIGTRLYRRRVGLLAAGFTAVSVLLIQHAHFFVVDPMTNTFVLACFYMAIRIKDEGAGLNYLLAGLFLGMAVASKISAAPLAAVIALAAAARFLQSPVERHATEMTKALRGVLLAAVVSVIAFRTFQPYAFSGPSFLGVIPNPDWLSTMDEIRRQTAGEVDFPPALQWVDRLPFIYSFRDMVLWGMGLPLGLTAWAAWGWALARILQGKSWSQHLLPVAWSGGYFLWRSSGFTQNMRYQLPIYPTLAILAAWGLWQLWERAGELAPRAVRPARIAAGLLGAGVLLLTTSYAFGFHRIYREPVTRVEASRWIYSHVPSAVNVVVSTAEGERLEPLAVPEDFTLEPGGSERLNFTARHEGEAVEVRLPAIRSEGEVASLRLEATLHGSDSEGEPLASGRAVVQPGAGSEVSSAIELEPATPLEEEAVYSLVISLAGTPAARIEGSPALLLETEGGSEILPLEAAGEGFAIIAGESRQIPFSPSQDGAVQGVRLASLETARSDPVQIQLSLKAAEGEETLASVTRTIVQSGQKGGPLEILFGARPNLAADEAYRLELGISVGGTIAFEGATIVHESSWDDPLPLRVDGYDIGGRYASSNLELYWSDDEDSDEDDQSDKLERIADSLTNGDYLFISSNRQYGSIARVPSRYPLTTAFYRALFSCPAPRSVWRCADTARPGELENELGYELIHVFDRNPSILGFEISDQGADESFTVYDHPQAMIFAKSPDFSRGQVIELLESVDISDLHQAAPKELRANNAAPNLMLPGARWRRLRQHGTWSELYPAGSPLNRSQPLAVVVWWLTIGALGLIALPLTWRAFPGLIAGGYGIARVVGLLLFAWLVWLAGSLGLAVGRGNMLLILFALLITAASVAWWDRERLAAALRRHRREILTLEAFALVLFLLFLFIRIGNPDLWHPSKGGEKPMDLSYLNAVLKSRTFPPYDPWFAGGYINYYYFGFLFVGMPIKLLGIEPAVAYNLVLATLFAVLGLAAYTGGYHLVASRDRSGGSSIARIAGFSAAISLCLLGNLGTMRMVWDGFQAAGGGEVTGNLLAGAGAAAKGFMKVIFGDGSLPIGLDSWYWEPSRSIPPGPGEPGPITEFPFFTFLYADLHAHMISLPLTVTSLVWSLSWMRAAKRVSAWSQRLFPLAMGALIIGALRPTNTWDFPVYLILGGLATLAAAWLRAGKLSLRCAFSGLFSVAVLVGLAFLLFHPYTRWYGQGYTEAQLWEGSKTGIGAYLTVYGLFLFILASWLAWETREWMATTPISFLAGLRPWLSYLAFVALALAVGVYLIYGLGYRVIVLVAPLVLWAGLLSLRRHLHVGRRILLFLAGTGLALTMVVEVVVLRGDIGRMNTVFKFYLQVWTLLSLAGGAALAWIVQDLGRWSPTLRGPWQLGLVVLVFGAALYPVTATPAKIRDRMTTDAPHTLDGTRFMQYAERSELGTRFALQDDYQAIQWMQAEVEGSPVILEANIPEYRWGTRYTIYTGLPNVLGWNWHQRQQRVAAGSEQVTGRAIAISEFYTGRSVEAARDFLDEYEVEYVVVGALEQIYYGTIEPCFDNGSGSVTCDLGGRPEGVRDPAVSPDSCEPMVPEAEDSPLSCPSFGLEKFEQMAAGGDLEVAYETADTRIYRVLP